MLLPYSLILRHLLGKRFVCQTGRAVGIVGQHAMCTGSAFCCARTDWDFCVVNFQRVTVGAAQGSTYILGQICTLIYHRQHNAVNIQPGIDTALYLVDGFEQGHQTFEGEMLRLHRNQHPVSRNKRCYGDDAQRGHTVDQAVVIFILKRLQCLFHDFLVRHNVYKAHFHIGQTNVGRNEIHLFFMVNYHFWRLFVLDNRFH